MAKERLHYIDVCKGILILLVALGHVWWLWITKIKEPSAIVDLIGIVYQQYSVFYLGCFFLITGFCSSINKPRIDFLTANIKSLLVPIPVLCFLAGFLENFSLLSGLKFLIKGVFMGTGPWFLYALFISKILLYEINKVFSGEINKILLVLTIYFLGILAINNKLPDYYAWSRAFALFPYIYCGYFIKTYRIFDKRKCLIFSTIVYLIILLFEYKFDFYFIGVTGGNASPFILSIPALITGLIGSFAIIYISKIIKESVVLESLGKHSLTIYMLHSSLIIFIFSLFDRVLAYCLLTQVLIVIISFIIPVTVSWYISIILNKKPFRKLIGKL